MNVRYYFPVSVAYDSRACYEAATTKPTNHSLSLTLLHHRSLSLPFFQNPNFLTGNTMQVILIQPPHSLIFSFYSKYIQNCNIHLLISSTILDLRYILTIGDCILMIKIRADRLRHNK